MGRLADAILSGAYTDENAYPTLDLQYGGQFGYSPKLGIIGKDGRIKAEWISNKAYVQRNIVPVLIEAPRFFNLMPNPEKWVAALKSLIETHSRTIEGLTATAEVETAENPLGSSNQVMEEPTKVTRERASITFNFIEKHGRSISRFLEKWIYYGIEHPDTGYSLLSTLPNLPDDMDMLPDWYSCTILYMEPDPTHTKVLHAWLHGYAYPKSTGEITGKFDKTTAGDIVTLSVPMAGFTQYNLGVTQFAQKILDQINITNANPYLAPAFADEVHPDVDAVNTGYKNDIENLAKSVTG